jgi:hypothetical protein
MAFINNYYLNIDLDYQFQDASQRKRKEVQEAARGREA